MKQKCKNILVSFLAAIVFFVGAGVTVMNFCCGECIKKIIVVESDMDSCHDMDMTSTHCDSTESDADHLAISSLQHEEDCCFIERISVDIDHAFFKPVIQNPLVWIKLSLVNDIFNVCAVNPLADIPVETCCVPTPIPPREYLSFIRVLVI